MKNDVRSTIVGDKSIRPVYATTTDMNAASRIQDCFDMVVTDSTGILRILLVSVPS